MDSKEIFDAFDVSGSAEIKFSARMFKCEEIKQEHFDGWDAVALIINLYGFFILYNSFFESHGIIVNYRPIIWFYFYTGDMASISDEIEVKDEPWIHSSEYDQVSCGVQVSRVFYFTSAL